jgi:hypothetical protein
MNKADNLGKYSKKGAIPWNLGKTHSNQTRKKIKESLLKKRESGWTNQALFKKGHIPYRTNKGKKFGAMSEEQKKKISIANKGHISWNKGKKMVWMQGDKNWNWKGGVSPIYRTIRNSIEYEEWRAKVFERDLYTCQMCGQIGGYLEADHIKPFAYFPELRFEVSNGRTLCKPCHKETDTYMGRAKNTITQV